MMALFSLGGNRGNSGIYYQKFRYGRAGLNCDRFGVGRSHSRAIEPEVKDPTICLM